MIYHTSCTVPSKLDIPDIYSYYRGGKKVQESNSCGRINSFEVKYLSTMSVLLSPPVRFLLGNQQVLGECTITYKIFDSILT